MNARNLNRLPRDIFSYKNGDEQVVKVNGADGTKTYNRNEIISMGRLAFCEKVGQTINTDKNTVEKYNSRVKDYGTFSKNVWEDTVLFCANKARERLFRTPLATMSELAKDTEMYTDGYFYALLASIATEVVSPLLPAVMEDTMDKLIDWQTVGIGEQRIIDIESNDFFVFDDSSYGAVSSKPRQQLYKAQVAVNAKQYTAHASIKWTADILNGDAGNFYLAFAKGAISKMNAITVATYKKAIGNAKYIPSAFTIDSFSKENWIKAVTQCAALNGVDRNSLTAIGSLAGLSEVAIAYSGTNLVGFDGASGAQWLKNGYFTNVMGVDLVEVGLTVVPGTQNYDPKFIGLDDDGKNIYLMAKAGNAPMAGVIEGSPISIRFTPTETADRTIDITETISFGIAPVFSSKVYKISV